MSKAVDDVVDVAARLARKNPRLLRA